MMFWYLGAAFLVSGVFAYAVLRPLIPKLIKAGIAGTDVNKPDKPRVAEMGGIGVVAGFALGVLLAVFFNTFMGFAFNLDFVLAALIAVYALAFIGLVDDLLDVPQAVKAFLPLVAGIPLIAVRAAGSTAMHIPFLGAVDLGAVYLFILIPLGMAVASNLTNMLAGFNGMEAGMGIIMLLAASLVALNVHSPEALVIYVPLMGALAGFLLLNRHPAKVFPGDVATLAIGAALAAGAIIGNFEAIAALLLLPYVADFFIKARNGFPSSKWWGEIRSAGSPPAPGSGFPASKSGTGNSKLETANYSEVKLYPVEGKVRGLAQLVMKLANGISEPDLVLVFIIMEEIVGIAVLILFLHIKIL